MKKIAVVTGTRAEYGLLKPLLTAIKDSKELQLQVLVTGAHLSEDFGNTYLQIEADGFTIDSKIQDDLDGDSAVAITKAVSKAMIGFAETYEEIKPNIIVVLGDRSELLAAASAAVIAGIPIAHIHGGETTEGAYDEFIRHSLTKMSHLHFTAAEAYRRRVIQLGENPNTVFNVGAIGIDSIMSLPLLNKADFEKSIETKLNQYSCIITFHPVTLEIGSAEKQFLELLKALETLKNTTLIFTKPNTDKGGRVLIKMIDDYVQNNQHKAVAFTSLGQLRYLSALKHVDFVIGNSSSGLIEVPLFDIPTINIGDRQKGRLTPTSVVNCTAESEAIISALEKIKTKNFKEKIKLQEKIFGDGNATPRIVEELTAFEPKNLKKSFFNLNQACFEKL